MKLILSIFTDVEGCGFTWQMLLYSPGVPYACKIVPIGWRRPYKRRQGAERAARKVAKKLGIEVSKTRN